VSRVAASQPLRALAPAKINLGLFVGPLRGQDGRHELVSVMQSISLADELTLEPAPEAQRDELVCPGVQTPPEDNLAMRALAAFREVSGWDAGPVRLQVEKRVPVAAGLGGGSGDAAAALRLAAAASGLGDQDMLLSIAATLGADVSAQVSPGRWLARGAGERLLALPGPRAPFGVLVLPDAEPLATAAVYGELDRHGALRSSEELERLAAELEQALVDGRPLPPAELIANDLQAPALALCPSIAASLSRARAAAAQTAIVSGSGPTVLGLYDSPDEARGAAQALLAQGISAQAATPVDDRFGAVCPLQR
jgi:4-diphosphocytidyl-2-C-methyl-D-erythritol kinase